MHTYTHVCAHIDIHTYMHTRIHTYMHKHIHTCAPTPTHIHACAVTHMHTHICAHARAHTHAHTHTHTHTWGYLLNPVSIFTKYSKKIPDHNEIMLKKEYDARIQGLGFSELSEVTEWYQLCNTQKLKCSWECFLLPTENRKMETSIHTSSTSSVLNKCWLEFLFYFFLMTNILK